MDTILTYVDGNKMTWRITLEDHIYILKKKSSKATRYTLVKKEKELVKLLKVTPGHTHLFKK